MKEAERELIASKQSRQLLLSYVSHELRTPVTSILGYVNALKDGTINSDKDISKAVDIIDVKSRTLERLINDLFQLSKLETGQFSFHFMRMNALELSNDLINRHLLDIRSAGLNPEYKIQSKDLSEIYLIVDPERIDQVFSNIIINAIKYSKENGKISIKVTLEQKTKEFSVAILDNGAGIPKDDLPFIFDRFYKGNPSPNHKRMPSTGLGLTISKEIIAAHHGTISAKSYPDKGSTFTFTIPIYTE
jgi:signal transduction histidine kinase